MNKSEQINRLVLAVELSLQLASVVLIRHRLERGVLGHHRGWHRHHVRISTVAV